MSCPQSCKCGRAHKGDGKFVKTFLWSHDNYLRETIINKERFGGIEKVEFCPGCSENVKNLGKEAGKVGTK